jgi:hypothetical protein
MSQEKLDERNFVRDKPAHGGTTDSPADEVIERVGSLHPDSTEKEKKKPEPTSEAGGVD